MSDRNSKAIQKYLQHYGESESDLILDIAEHIHGKIDQAIVIPAFKESEHFLQRLLPLKASSYSTTLTVIVLNGPIDIRQEDADASLAVLHYLQSHCEKQADLNFGLSLFSFNHHWVVCVDLIQQRPDFWSQYGVGFARKLGMDMCLWLYHQELLVSPFVRSSDGDVIWPHDYLDSIHHDEKVSAIIYPFRHGPVRKEDKAECQAAFLYDAWLRYYVEGLRWAGSPWAFHTIGSTLAIHLQHYAINRGFPKREAGEDFYLLNKLAKTGSIITLDDPLLILSNRQSNRTPFGTGKSIADIIHSAKGDWQFYHPEIFQQLRYWYSHQQHHYGKNSIELPTEAQPIKSALIATGVEKQLKHCNDISRNEKAYLRQLNHKLDAALTRKIVHWLRDHYYASVAFTELCDLIGQNTIPFISNRSDYTISTPRDLAQRLYEPL